MFTTNEMRKRLAELLEKRSALAEKIASEKRAYSADEEKEDDTLKSEAESLERSIARAEEVAGLKPVGEERKVAPVDVKITREDGCDEKGNCVVFRDFGEQLMAVKEVGIAPHRRNEKLEKCQKIMRAATGLNESQAADGGFLVQTDQASGLIKRAYETAVIAPRCQKIGISAGSNGLKINALDETSRANGSRLGGIAAYWENEADLYVGSRPKFRQMELVLKKLTGLCYATEELLADANALSGVISEGFAQEFGFKLDDAVIRGTGVGQPKGILGSEALVSVAKEGSQVADTIVLNNVVKMRSRLWSRSRGNSVWLINQDCEPQLNVLSLTVGNNSYPVLLPATGISGAPYDTMYGRPVIPTEYNETVGDKGDIILADFSQYLLIDKGSMQQASSVHVRFLYDEMTFKFTYRVDGQPTWNLPLTPYKGANTQSPFITLDARA